MISNEDKQFYKQILDDSNAIYQKFDSNQKRLNSDPSDKWRFIKNELLTSTKTGSSISVELLPSNSNSLVEMLGNH